MQYKEIKIVGWIKKIKKIHAILKNGEEIDRKLLKKPFFKIQCSNDFCKKNRNINFYKELNKRIYICPSCKNGGRRRGIKHTPEAKEKMRNKKLNKYKGKDNPFYGRHHTEETKNKIRAKNLGKNTGKDAPFYGRHHTEENKKIIKEKNKIWRDNLSIEEKNKISKKISDSQKKLYEKDPKKYLENKSKAAKASCMSIKRYSKNKIELIVEEELKKLDLHAKYSIILGYKQYDFGLKNEKILIEVMGDYWHGNPKKYPKNKLNSVQLKVIEKDKLKKKFAESHGFKIYYIWEDDINHKNFKILKKIKNEIQKNNSKS